MSGAHLSVVLPCRNQATYIGAVLQRFLDVVGREVPDSEFVCVPNACSDSTVSVLREHAARDGRVRIVELLEAGWGRAVRAGLAHSRGTVLCYTNAARTNPDVLLTIFRRAEAHPEAVVKARRVERQAPLRTLGSWIYNAEARAFFGIRGGDVNGTPKFVPRAVYERLVLTSDGDLLDLELLAQVRRLGVPVIEVPVAGFERHGGRSSTGMRSAIAMWCGAVGLRLAQGRRH